jgi:hypothetical protein
MLALMTTKYWLTSSVGERGKRLRPIPSGYEENG